MASPTAQTAVARVPMQSGLAPCRVNGKLIQPKVDQNRPYGWAFVVNFDAPASSSGNPISCLATRTLPLNTEYEVAEHCAVVRIANPPATFGGGVARFNGNSFLTCNIEVEPTQPYLFYVRAMAQLTTLTLSTLSPTLNYTLLSSDAVSVTAQTSACRLTMNSRYNTFNYSHSFVNVCGGFFEIGSRMQQNFAASPPHVLLGRHVLSGTVLGPTTGLGELKLPAEYAFSIGAPGEKFDVDWYVIDPTPQKSGG
jgi:hypothetical protein